MEIDDEGAGKPGERGRFFANNVAFDREFFLAHPFPPMPEGVTRGACGTLERELSKRGIPLWWNLAALALRI